MNILARVFRIISVYKPFPVISKRFFDHDCRKKNLYIRLSYEYRLFLPQLFFSIILLLSFSIPTRVKLDQTGSC